MKALWFAAFSLALVAIADAQTLPDLTVNSVNGPAAASTATSVTLTNVMANIDAGAAGNWSYRVYLSNDPVITTNDRVLTTQGLFSDFPAQTTITNTVGVMIPTDAATGTNYFGVIVNYDNAVAESNLTNNARASGPVIISIGPDLAVLSVAGPAAAATAQAVTLTNIMANTGVGAAGNWSYRVYLSADPVITTNDRVLTTQGAFSDFQPQTTITNTVVVMIPTDAPAGTNYFGALINYDNAVIESTATNNAKASGPVTISIGPDLTVLSVRGPAAAATSQSVTLTNVMANTGVGAAGNWSYRIYLSPDPVITTNDRVLTTQGAFVNFPAQTAITNTVVVLVPSDASLGTNYFGVIVNYDNAVAESNLANNAGASGPVTIGIGPDLAVLAVVGPGNATTGQSVTVSSTLANLGTGAAGSWSYRIYLSSDPVIATNDVVLTTQGAFVDFPAQTAVTNAIVVVIPPDTPAGTNYFGVIVNYDNAVIESSLTNNAKASGQVLIGPVIIRPVISAIAYQTNSIVLSIDGLTVSSTCSVDTISAFPGALVWTTGALFTAEGTSTNVSDFIPASVTSRYYRVRQR